MKRHINNRYLTLFLFIRTFILKVECFSYKYLPYKNGLVSCFLTYISFIFLYIDCA
jgi:hypothetical protein